MFGISTSNGMAAASAATIAPKAKRGQHDVRAVLGDRRVDVGGVLAQRPGELLLEQRGEELPRSLALPIPVRVVLGRAVGPVGRLDPASERGAGGPHVVDHRVLGEDGDVVPALDEAAHDAELDGDGAAAVDERDEIAIPCAMVSPSVVSRMPSTSWMIVCSVSARLRPRSRRSSFHV